MATIPGFRFDITGASGSQGLLGPKNGYRCYVLPRGGYAAQDSTGALITFDSAAVASRFAVGNWLQAGLLTANIRQVGAVGGNSLSISGSNLTITENDRIFLIGNTEPTVSGGSATYGTPNTIVRQRDDDAADLYTNSMLTSNADGLVQGFAITGVYDLIVQDGNRANQGSVIDLSVGLPEGISVSDWAFFGATVTMHAALGVTGWATFGSTVTMHGALGVTGDAVFGATVTTKQFNSIRFAAAFAGADIGAQINAADTDLGAEYGEIWADIDNTTMTTGVTISTGHTLRLLGGNMDFNVTGGGKGFAIKNHAQVIGAGSRNTYIGVLATANVSAIFTNDDYAGLQQDATVEGVFIDCSADPTIGIAPVYFKRVGEPSKIRDVYVLPVTGASQVGIKLTDASGVVIDDITVNSNNAAQLAGIWIDTTINSFGNNLRNIFLGNFPTGTPGILVKPTSGTIRSLSIIGARCEQSAGNSCTTVFFDGSGVANAIVINPTMTANAGTHDVVGMSNGASGVVVINSSGFLMRYTIADWVNNVQVSADCSFYSQEKTNDVIRTPMFRFLAGDSGTCGRVDLFSAGGSEFLGWRFHDATGTADWGNPSLGFRWMKANLSAPMLTVGNTGTIGFGPSGASTMIFTNTGNPEGVYTAPIGSLFLRIDGGTGSTLYVKQLGTTSSGWGAM